ncbi:MAG: hypothetical protein ABR906_01215 [Terracidiphilus sp.]|jgi:hypothetical protein
MPSLLEERFGRDHLLVKYPHDLNTVGYQNVEHYVLANLEAT